eukprot:6043427-Pyramimonas_sp.AAC.2
MDAYVYVYHAYTFRLATSNITGFVLSTLVSVLSRKTVSRSVVPFVVGSTPLILLRRGYGLTASGCRALCGLVHPDGGNVKEWALKFEGAASSPDHDKIENYPIKAALCRTSSSQLIQKPPRSIRYTVNPKLDLGVARVSALRTNAQCAHPHLHALKTYPLVTMFTSSGAPVCSAVIVLGAVLERDESTFAVTLMDFIGSFATGAPHVMCRCVYTCVPLAGSRARSPVASELLVSESEYPLARPLQLLYVHPCRYWHKRIRKNE